MNNIINVDTKICASHCDNTQRLRFDAVLNFFQDLATQHAIEMKTDYNTLKATSNAFWVISKIKFKLTGDITYGDDVSMSAWPLKPQLIRFLRDFKIDGKNGNVVGSSEWCILDCDTLSIRKLDSVCYPKDLEHLEVRSGVSPFTKLREDITDVHLFGDYTCVYTDIDCNGHVNNVSYSKMALNTFTPQEFSDYGFNAFEINFISQSYLGDKISIYKKKTDFGVYVEGRKQDKQVFKCLFYKE